MAEPLRLFDDAATTEDFTYEVRVSERARRIRVVVEHDGRVEVVLPRRARQRDAQRAVEELRPWIERRLADVHAVRASLARTPGTVPYLGEELTLVPQRGRTRVHRRDAALLVPAGDDEGAALERWYRRQARAEVAPRHDVACAAIGREYTALTIRNQRTRWGSCSSTGAMSFNWRLLLAPAEILDYVVWHEACHLVVMDHSPRFWSLVERHHPGYRDAQRWLRRNGAGLQL
jgi:predicted metal-dependent hydrolase